MKTLQEIRAWVEAEAASPEPPSALFQSVCDELQLIKAYEAMLHNHTIDEQVEFLTKEMLLKDLPPPLIQMASTILGSKDPQKIMDFSWERIDPEIRAREQKVFREKIELTVQKHQELKRNYDFANNRFYCTKDLEVMDQIQNSINFIHGLFQRYGKSS